MKIINASFPILLVFALLVLVQGCKQGPTTEAPTDNPTSGEINIAVDETFAPIIKAELDVFQSIYPNAHITAEYLPEAACFDKLMNKEVRLVIASRKLNAAERRAFDDLKLVPKEVKLATDALAFIVNPGNSTASLKPEELRGILNGSITTWSQIRQGSAPEGAQNNITLVFDHAGSSTVRYVKDSILMGDSLAKQVFASGTNPAVIEYVAQNAGAIGVIGVNWVSDQDSENALDFLQIVRVLELQAPMFAAEGGYYQPFQAYIALKNYPHLREVYSVSREARQGLGTGFVNFIAGEKGQRVILKSGLLPAYIPVRIVEFPKKENAEDIDKFIINEYQKKNE